MTHDYIEEALLHGLPDSDARLLRLPGPVPVHSTQGTLALDLEPRRDPPRWRSVRPMADVVSLPHSGQREAEAWAQRFVQAAVEIVGGDRPATQLVRWTSREIYDNLQRRAHLVARAGGHEPGVRRVQPVRPQVQTVHASFVSTTIVETCVRVRYGERSRAVAARFERRQNHWLCTALDFS